MNRKPLLNYGDKDLPNIGTVVFLDSHDYSPSKCSIGYWRDTHPAHRVELVYGVKGICSKGRLTGMGHGMFLAVSSPNLTRYYSHGAGNVDVDELKLPMQVIRDWDEFIQPLPRKKWPLVLVPGVVCWGGSAIAKEGVKLWFVRSLASALEKA